MEKIESILYSIVPLILIILFSWLFSFLGSKMRKQQEETGPEPEKTGDYRLIDLMTGQTEAQRSSEAKTTSLDWTGASPGVGQTVQKVQPMPGGPQVTPRPIRPKWWGA